MIHKVGNVDIFLLLKFENKIAREICHSDYNSKHYDKCKFDLKLIKFLTVSNLFPLEVVPKCQHFISNFVYYGKTRLQVGTSVNSTRHDC